MMSAFDEGWIAAIEDKNISDNPYPIQTSEHDEWERGWNEWHSDDLLDDGDD